MDWPLEIIRAGLAIMIFTACICCSIALIVCTKKSLKGDTNGNKRE